jgi:hypothetical protein
MTAKEYLKSIARDEANIRAKKARLSVMDELSVSISSPALSDMPRNPNRGASRLENSIMKKAALEAEIMNDETRLKIEKAKALDLIGRIDNPEYQTILIARYFKGESWETIAEEMYYSRSWVFRLHGYALRELDSIISKSGLK